ncbi:arylamine N-acetyltransferase [Shewanella colwelliana]|uniref:arylamine N-acetyltransferase n=1 Tax=Shewanella colwelliana TaxID=23 RepID=UPI00299D7673|nr:arylamine N-acetyltransferase [Shewanella colwelliana]MDX1279583.1 arylamine N-acetyltransferase [Shewanella colwelliana]
MTLKIAQKILLEKFQREPFHNFYLLNDAQPNTCKYGGTCSDKTLSYLEATKTAGLDAHLHSARIGGKEIHRLVRLEIDNQRYFADIGNGWPSIHLFPANTPIEYECYGMAYRTQIEDGVITVYHRKNGVEKQQMEIDIAEKSDVKIRQSIVNRFSSNITYPFSNQLRFSMIVEQRFLFIRDTRLEMYSSDGYEEVPNVTKSDIKAVIMKYFNYDISPLESFIFNKK